MVAHEGTSLVGLTVDIHGMEGFVQSLVEWPVFPVKLLAHRHLELMDPFLLHVTSELQFTFCTSRKISYHLLDLCPPSSSSFSSLNKLRVGLRIRQG